MTFTPSVLTTMDSNNSSSTPLSSSSSFIGTSKVTTGYNTLILSVKSDVDSASGGIQVQFSDDNITFETLYTDTYFASSYFIKNYEIIKKYYRITYVNSTSAQSTFNLQSRISTDLDSNSTTTNTSITVFDNSVENTLDAFGKLRVANPVTLLDLRFPGMSTASSSFLNNTLQVDTLSSGSYSAAFSNSKAVFTGSGTGYYMTQSRNYCVYQPGKSLLFMASGVFSPGNSTYTARIGYFDSEFTTDPTTPTVNNGVFFQYSSGTMNVCLKNNTLTIIPQSSWNVDKMDGTGPSGLNLDFTKTQLCIIDMEWLGVGRVRYGFFAYGRIQYCHQITNINILTQPYTNNINLPISFSLIGGTGSGSITQICSTVISEGGYNPTGRPFTISTGSTPVTCPYSGGVGTETAIIAIRGGGSNYYHQNIIPTGLSYVSTSTNDLVLYRLRLYLEGNTGGTTFGSWTQVNSNYSVVQYNLGTSISTLDTSNSIILDDGYFYGRGSNTFGSLTDVFSTQIQQITSNIQNVSDVLILTCQKITGSGSSDAIVYGSMNWQELY